MEMCRMEKWSTRILQERINSMLYERTSISKMPEQTIKNEIQALESNKELTNNLVFRDPYLLEILGNAKDVGLLFMEFQKYLYEVA